MRIISSRLLLLVSAGAFVVLAGSGARADLRPEKVYVAENRKTQTYIRDGLITGGDQAIQDFVVRDIRRANNLLYERIVIDLQGNQGGEPAEIQRPPFYQVAVNPDEKRMVFTLWEAKLSFDAKKVEAAFKKSEWISSVDLYPVVDRDSWTFSLEMKSGQPVEVFELSDPVRIIIDIKNSREAIQRESEQEGE